MASLERFPSLFTTRNSSWRKGANSALRLAVPDLNNAKSNSLRLAASNKPSKSAKRERNAKIDTEGDTKRTTVNAGKNRKAKALAVLYAEYNATTMITSHDTQATSKTL